MSKDLNVAAVLLDALGQKPNCTVTTVTSVTGGVINSTTINIEYSSDENELVAKTFDTVDALLGDARRMAKTGGFTTSVNEFYDSERPDSAEPGPAR